MKQFSYTAVLTLILLGSGVAQAGEKLSAISSANRDFSISELLEIQKSAGLENGLIELGTVYMSNNGSWQSAHTDCQMVLNVLGLMSNDKLMISGSCEPSDSPICTYYFCTKLKTKAVVISE